MIYLVPLIFSVPFSYGLNNLFSNQDNIYMYLVCIVIFYAVGIIYRATLARKNGKFEYKAALGTLTLSFIFTLIIYISSPKHIMDFVTFLAIFIGSIFYSFIIFKILSIYVEGLSISGFVDLLLKGIREISNMKVVDYLGLFIPLVLMTSWLLLENQGAWADEPAKYISVHNMLLWTSNNPNLFYRIKVFYLFDWTYPPLFFFLSIPFLLYFRDWALGGRVFVMFISVINIWLLFYYLKRHLSILAALVGSVLLITGVQYIWTTREYAPEILLITFLLLLLIVMSRFAESENRSLLFVAGMVFALGMLTKYNYVVYAVIPILYYLGVVHFRTLNYKKLLNDSVLLSLPFMLLASPWYIYTYITNPANDAIAGYFRGINMGHYSSNVSVFKALLQIWQNKYAYFPSFTYGVIAILFLCLSTIYVIDLIRRKKISSDNLGELFLFPLACVVILSIGITMLGLAMTVRWNLSYVFVPIIAAYMLDGICSRKRSIGIVFGLGLYCILLFGFTNLAIRRIVSNSFFQPDSSLRPNVLTTGAKDAVEIIKNDKLQHQEKLTDPITVGFIGHIHYGLHGHALAFYGMSLGFTKWQESNTGILNGYKPTDISVFVNTDYLIYIPHNTHNSEEASFPYSLRRFQWMIENAPATYKECLKQIGEVHSRFGQVVVDKVDHSCFTTQTYSDLISTGMQYDAQHPPFLLFWDVEEMKYQKQLLLSNGQVQQLCEQTRQNINRQKKEFSAYYLNLIMNDISDYCK